MTNKNVEIKRITNQPKLDGIIADDEWQNLPSLNNFVQYLPYNGLQATEKSSVKIGYDNYALYIAANFYDSKPNQITQIVSSRDEIDKSINDLISIVISPYNDNNNAFNFIVTTTGAQQDEKCLPDGSEDNSWNAVWESAVKVTDKGWTAEIKIPFSALRFSSDKVQNWGFNILRRSNRLDEWSSWNPVDNKSGYFFNNNGLITGLKDLNPPMRLSFTPYVSGYSEKTSNGKWTNSYNAGMDLKYGINESYTVDVILVPDFGQVQSDDQELNLSPYELKFDEKRQFFTEGMELFNKGNIFYSRRIGNTPAGYWDIENELNENEVIEKNPTETKLINALKFSGKSSSGLAIGILNAMTSSSEATIKNKLTGKTREIETQGFTNYNMLVIDKQLSKNSFLGFANTNVKRNNFIANVFATDFRFANSENSYAISGTAALSYVDDNKVDNTGYRVDFKAGKISGKFQYQYNLELTSDKYNPNHLGYLWRGNEIVNSLVFKYNIYDPFGSLLNLYNTFTINYKRSYLPDMFTAFELVYDVYSTFKNRMYLNFWGSINPVEEHNLYVTEVKGRKIMWGKGYGIGVNGSTDSRKPFTFGFNFETYHTYSYNPEYKLYQISIDPAYKFGKRSTIYLNSCYNYDESGLGVVEINNDNIYVGERDVNTIENSLGLEYKFNNDISFGYRMRHYWSEVTYKKFHLLNIDGYTTSTDYTGDHNLNYNAFTMDVTLRWTFMPGSEMSLVWKNSIFSEDKRIDLGYFSNLSDVFNSPQSNSLSLKMLYYVDYLSL